MQIRTILALTLSGSCIILNPLRIFQLALDARCEVTISFIMAIPRPMRLLAVVTLGLFCFLLIILFRGPTTVNQISGEHAKPENWERDPNLDRTDFTFLCMH